MIDISFEAPAEPRAIVATERIPYPLARVWRAHSEALFLRQWWAPHGYTNRLADLDARPGGAWRVVQADPDGNEYSFYGRVSAVVEGQRLERSLITEVFPDVTSWLRVDLAAAAAGGTVTVTTHAFPDERSRAGFLALGGVDRMREASQRLDALLSSMS